MKTFKLRYHQLGGHVHVAVFVANAPNQTFAKSGDLVFSASEEFTEFLGLFREHASVLFEDRTQRPHAEDYRP